jgi:hypothetical protein
MCEESSLHTYIWVLHNFHSETGVQKVIDEETRKDDVAVDSDWVSAILAHYSLAH